MTKRVIGAQALEGEKEMATTKANGATPMVVTTSHRGVFFGYGTPTEEKIIRLTQCRMCVYWSADVKGVLGLAVTGPSKNCRVTPAVPALTIQDVTAIGEATPEAVKAWESGPWQR